MLSFLCGAASCPHGSSSPKGTPVTEHRGTAPESSARREPRDPPHGMRINLLVFPDLGTIHVIGPMQVVRPARPFRPSAGRSRVATSGACCAISAILDTGLWLRQEALWLFSVTCPAQPAQLRQGIT